MYFADTCPEIGVEPTDGLLIILAILCNDILIGAWYWEISLREVLLVSFFSSMSVRCFNKCGKAACSSLLMMHAWSVLVVHQLVLWLECYKMTYVCYQIKVGYIEHNET